jgi:probable HAF family extracellular repeat protein
VSVARRHGASAGADVAIVALGTLGGAVSQAKAVNRWGHVVGSSRDRSGRSRGFVWTPERGIVDLEPCAGVNSSANDVNDVGDVVGGGDTGFGAFHAYLLSEGTALDLGTLGGEESEALALNRLGQIAGHSRLGGGAGKHAFFIREPGRMLDLGTLGGATSVAHAVNDRGTVVGLAETATGAPRAFRWTAEEGMVELDTLAPGASMALGINNRGDIVGGSGRAVLWTEGRGLVDLGSLGGPTSCANDVNDAGAIVGVSQTGDTDRRGRPVSHAFLRTPDGAMLDLGTLGGAGSAAAALSEPEAGACFIAGHSHDAAGALRAVVWKVRLG